MGRSDLVRRCGSCGSYVEDPAASRTGACMYDLVMIGGRYYYRSVEFDEAGCDRWFPERRDDRPEPESGCRFCGASYEYVMVRCEPHACAPDRPRRHWCECTVCGACGPYGGSRVEAIDLWEGGVVPFNAPCDEPATETKLAYGFNLMGEGVEDES